MDLKDSQKGKDTVEKMKVNRMTQGQMERGMVMIVQRIPGSKIEVSQRAFGSEHTKKIEIQANFEKCPPENIHYQSFRYAS